MSLTITYTFAPNTLIRSAYMNQNFDDCANAHNTHIALVTAHGSLVSTAIDYTVAAGVTCVIVSSTAVARTISIPAARLASNAPLAIKDGSGAAGTNNITIDTGGAETIDGFDEVVICEDGGAFALRSDGSNWWIM